MSAPSRKLAPTKGPFPNFPGQVTQDEFRTWVRETGKPDVWRHHDPTMPPRDKDFVEVLRFEIPEKLQTVVDRASCPICSPEAPKYYKGVLAWFPYEGVLRAIGHECAKSHFGEARRNEATRRGRHQRAIDAAQYFLIETLPQVARLRAEVAGRKRIARDIDTLRQAFWKKSSKTACAKLARLGQSGELSIEEERKITTVDVYGKEQIRRENAIVGTFPVAGLGFLTRQFSVLGLAESTALALEKIKATDDEEALNFVTEELQEPQHLFQAETLARATVHEMEKLREAIAEARAFLSPNNLATLSGWSGDRRSGAPISIRFDRRYPARVEIAKPGRRGQIITVPEHFRQEDSQP